jgi:branched-chain amino acid transport system substrate-binding protein
MDKEYRFRRTRTRGLVESGLLFGLGLLALAAAGCGDDPAGPEPGHEPITLAAALAETGRHAGAGNDLAWGYRLAVDLLNGRGGIAGRPVQLVIRDDGSDPETSARLYSGFVASDTIHALLGPYSSVITEAVLPVAEEAGLPLVAPMAAAPELWAGQQRQWSVQMLNPGPTYVQGSVELAAQAGARTVALIYEDTAFPRSLAGGVREAAEAHGLDLVLDQAYPVGEADHEVLAAAARDADGDLLAIGGYGQDLVDLRIAVDQVGYVPRMLSLNGPAAPLFVSGVGELARCVAGGAPWVPALRTSGFIGDSETLVMRFEAAEGSSPDHRPAGGFGAVEVLAEAIEAALAATGKPDPAAIRDHLFALETETVLGPFSVYPPGDSQAGAQRALKGVQIQWQDDGEGGLALRIIHPETVAEAPPCFMR